VWRRPVDSGVRTLDQMEGSPIVRGKEGKNTNYRRIYLKGLKDQWLNIMALFDPFRQLHV
jgi:hypothetical protein